MAEPIGYTFAIEKQRAMEKDPKYMYLEKSAAARKEGLLFLENWRRNFQDNGWN